MRFNYNKKNNLIILLLININHKLDKLQDKSSSSKPQDIEDLIKGISNLDRKIKEINRNT